MSFFDDLCYRCRGERSDGGYGTLAGDHCHHEPREKPKPGFTVWSCKVVVKGDVEIPDGFDFHPRRAAIEAIEASGIEVLSCFSGWAGKLTETQTEIVEENCRRILCDK